MSRKLGRARIRISERPIAAHVRRWQHQRGERSWEHMEARRGARVGVTKPTLAARKAKRRAHRKQ